MTPSSLLDTFDKVLLGLGATAITAMLALMNCEVVMRYFFNRSINIADEYAGYCFTAATMLCFVPAIRRGRFIRIEGLVNRFPSWVQAVLELVAAALGFAVSIIFTYETFSLAWSSYLFDSVSMQLSETPLAIPQAIMPIGFLLTALAFAETGIRRSIQLWRGETPVAAANLEVHRGLD